MKLILVRSKIQLGIQQMSIFDGLPHRVTVDRQMTDEHFKQSSHPRPPKHRNLELLDVLHQSFDARVSEEVIHFEIKFLHL